MTSLYERLGGEAAVEAAVVRFYERVLDDAQLAPFFAHLDMPAQVKKQIAFMTMAFGGPTTYTGRDLKTAHAGLVKQGLSDVHFDLIAEHLKVTLVELEVGDGVIAEVLQVVGGTRGDVLGRT